MPSSPIFARILHAHMYYIPFLLVEMIPLVVHAAQEKHEGEPAGSQSQRGARGGRPRKTAITTSHFLRR